MPQNTHMPTRFLACPTCPCRAVDRGTRRASQRILVKAYPALAKLGKLRQGSAARGKVGGSCRKVARILLRAHQPLTAMGVDRQAHSGQPHHLLMVQTNKRGVTAAAVRLVDRVACDPLLPC